MLALLVVIKLITGRVTVTGLVVS